MRYALIITTAMIILSGLMQVWGSPYGYTWNPIFDINTLPQQHEN